MFKCSQKEAIPPSDPEGWDTGGLTFAQNFGDKGSVAYFIVHPEERKQRRLQAALSDSLGCMGWLLEAGM